MANLSPEVQGARCGSWALAVASFLLEDSGRGTQDIPEHVKQGGKAEVLIVLWQREMEAKKESFCPKAPKVS